MKELQVIQPDYVANFSCVGSACRDHCCKRWSITLDKDTYRKYAKSQNADIRRIAVTNIIVSKKSQENWASIKLNEEQNCPYLDEERLCNVHKRLGGRALSVTCATYPRMEHIYKKQKLNTLTISCPEAARQVLLNPNALNMQATTITQTGNFKASDLNMENQLVNLFCANLIMPEQSRIEENLYAITSFLLYYQKLSGDVESKLPAMETAFGDLVNKLQNGDIAGYLSNIPFNQGLQWQLLMRLQKFTTDAPHARGRETLFGYLGHLINHLVVDFDNEQLEERMKQLGNVWNEQAIPFLNQRPYLLRNYFLYRLHHDQFAMKGDQPLLKSLYLLVVDYFFIKSLISAHLIKVGDLTEEHVIDIFYSYHTFRQHSAKATADFIHEIDQVKVNDDLSLLQLLV
ncbi:flagellin lysine-N-methylase [Yersinia nurmii]|uniref:Flagellin lysine-N-methylase n=1 Tax=Yersinia nurmii TaxID=685706 RepID=A0AAW7K377_9GAMM|nr:flagellin lysine-N-methylase [Yersinia nurmii]MDN0089256.1 flagellin lysine-N-methylase [Yersinia nurmii]